MSADNKEITLLLASVLLVIVLAIDYLGVYDIVTISNPPYSPRQIVTGLEPILIIVLTYAIYQTYQRQSDIMADQRSFNEYQQSAILQFDDYKIVSLSDSQRYQNSENPENMTVFHTEFVEFTISNLGNAPAQNLKAELYIGLEDNSHTISPPLVQNDWKGCIDKLLSPMQGLLFFNPKNKAIMSEKEAQIYTAPLITVIEDIPETWDPGFKYRFPPVSSVVEYAKEATDSNADFLLGLVLWYKDGSGKSDPQCVKFVQVPQSEVVALSDLQDNNIGVEDRLDLSQLFNEVGEPVTDESLIPELQHPDVRTSPSSTGGCGGPR